MGSLLPWFLWFFECRRVYGPRRQMLRSTCHLCFGDVAVDRQIKPQVVRITVKQSKTDPFRKGIDLYIGRTGK